MAEHAGHPSFTKSPEALAERFGTVMERHPSVTRRKMFGYPAAFVGGNLATGLFQAHWFVRLSEADGVELLAIEGAGPFEPMAGRPMKGYAVLPEAVVADDAAVDRWVERALAFTGTLPPKG